MAAASGTAAIAVATTGSRWVGGPLGRVACGGSVVVVSAAGGASVAWIGGAVGVVVVVIIVVVLIIVVTAVAVVVAVVGCIAVDIPIGIGIAAATDARRAATAKINDREEVESIALGVIPG